MSELVRLVDNALVHERCPLCDADRVTDLGPLSSPRRVRFSSVTVDLEHAPSLGSCEACGSRFVQHAIPESTAAELYSSGDAGSRWASTSRWDKTHAIGVVSAIRSLATPGARWLDVGSNTGELLDFVRAHGARTEGVEYSEASRRASAAKGHAMHARTEDARGPFEVVTAFDLVEHLYDVRGFLRSVAERVVSGGRLVILTGDIDGTHARRDGASWWYVQPPEHVMFPSHAFYRSLPDWSVESLDVTHSGPPARRGLWVAIDKRIRRISGATPVVDPTFDHVLVTLRRR